ncbi:MAG: [FeFe] hydrogenase, group A [Candidatus Zixiibacteriota bacterium]|jgi:iron-only hydrogenase group A
MWVEVNGKRLEVPPDATVLDAVSAAGESLPEAPLGRAREWIHSPRCPLLGLAEVDGQVIPLSALAVRKVREGTSIVTNSPELEATLAERARLLVERHECHFVREWQKMTAVEGENTGFITFEEWETFSFDERGSAPSIRHDPNKCIRCQACVDTCRDVQGVEALSFDEELGVIIDEDRCVRCGQCIHRCPMGAIEKYDVLTELLKCRNCAFARPVGAMAEVDETETAWDLLHDDRCYCVAQFAPAVRASLGEEFGMLDGELVTRKLYAALRRLGFKQVWDTNFAADLTIMEEGSELLERVGSGGRLPMFTSCSPGWITFAETFFPELLPHLSSAKSPQQMFGAVAKSMGAKSLGVEAGAVRVVSIMPCTAKKAEAARPEMTGAAAYWRESAGNGGDPPGFRDVDLVLTTRELARLLKMAGIDLKDMPEEDADPLLGAYTGAAPIFGRTGGVMEAALRTAVVLLTGEPPAPLEFDDLGSEDGIKRAELALPDLTVKVAVVHGLANARKVCESVREGGEFADYHFIEVMACPGGCVGGGGQPIPTNDLTKRSRSRGLNRDDREVCAVRMSHENAEVRALYEAFLEKPLGHLSHLLLHTHYTPREEAEE